MAIVKSKKVNEEGHITGLKAYAGREVLLIPRFGVSDLPNGERVEKALAKPRAIFGEFTKYVREHTDLSAKQYREFADRHGDPAAKARAYAKALSPEEFKARAKELEAFVQERLAALATDIEHRYEVVETEIDEAVERIFGRKNGASTDGGHAAATSAKPKKAKAKKPRAAKAERDEPTGPGEVPL